MLRSWPPYFLGQVVRIQPRAPMARLNSGEWLVAKSPAGAQSPLARASARNARTSLRSASHAGGSVTGSKRKAMATGPRSDLLESGSPMVSVPPSRVKLRWHRRGLEVNPAIENDGGVLAVGHAQFLSTCQTRERDFPTRRFPSAPVGSPPAVADPTRTELLERGPLIMTDAGRHWASPD